MFQPSISFGKKIPVAKCHIQDRTNNNQVNATIVEYDCNDLSDMSEIKRLHNWTYSKFMSDNMERVFKTKQYFTPSFSFFAIENDNKEIVGIASTKSVGGDLILDSLESSPDKKYKYTGKNMLTFLKNYALLKGLSRIYIPIAVESARDFYINKCGFKRAGYPCNLYVNCHNAPKLNEEIIPIANA